MQAGADTPTSGQPTSPTLSGPASVYRVSAPQRLGQFTIRARIGGGGMGDVYEAVQDEPRRTVAIKVLRSAPSADALARFRAEAQILGQFSHPAIAQIYEADTHERDGSGVPYLAMELIPGARPITGYADALGLSVADRLRLFAQVCRAVEHAHAHRVIHRDLKPGNILVDERGHPKVIDFGVARFTAGDQAGPTQAGQIVGTLRYMSPEQVEGDPLALDERTDVYSLGVVLYELLCGRAPYDLGDAAFTEAVRIIQNRPPTPPRRHNPGLDADVVAVLNSALAKQPEARYPSAGAMAADLEALARGDSPRWARRGALRRAASRARRLARRHPVAASAAGAAAAWVFGALVSTSFLASPLAGRCLALLPAPAVAPGAAPRYDRVRIIGITDDTDMAALAAQAGIAGVLGDEAGLRSWRLAHGRLLERLAGSGAAVVAVDLQFGDAEPHEVPYDEGFVAGAKALTARVPGVLGVDGWAWQREDPPPTSRTIAPCMPWGSISLFRQDRTGEQFAALAGWVDGGDPMPSLSLLAFAHARFPGAEARLRADPLGRWVELRGERPSALNPRVGVPVGSPVRLPIAMTTETSSENPGEEGRSVRVAWQQVSVPPDETCRAMLVPYPLAWGADEATLRSWFEGRVVILAEARAGRDDFRAPDGRVLPASIVHAGAVAQLLSAAPRPVQATGPHNLALIGAGALAGVLVGRACRPRVMLALALLGLTAGAIAVSLFTSARWGYQWLPIPALAAAALAVGLVRAAGKSAPRAREAAS